MPQACVIDQRDLAQIRGAVVPGFCGDAERDTVTVAQAFEPTFATCAYKTNSTPSPHGQIEVIDNDLPDFSQPSHVVFAPSFHHRVMHRPMGQAFARCSFPLLTKDSLCSPRS